MSEIYHFLFIKGGPVMYPIAVGSIAALALFCERIWSLRAEKVAPKGLRGRVSALVQSDRVPEALALLSENSSSLSRVLQATLRHEGNSREVIRQSTTDAGRREVSLMDRPVELLGTIASVEPWLGLLGTVIGLIRTFQRVQELVAKGHSVNPGELAAGIWVAMITTAAGLAVAIPAYLGYRYLQSRVGALVDGLEEGSLEIANLIARKEEESNTSEPEPADKEYGQRKNNK